MDKAALYLHMQRCCSHNAAAPNSPPEIRNVHGTEESPRVCVFTAAAHQEHSCSINCAQLGGNGIKTTLFYSNVSIHDS